VCDKSITLEVPNLATGGIMKLLMVIALASLGACATDPNKIGATYVSPTPYRSWDCGQISEERGHVESRCATLYSQLKKEANGDKWQMGVGAVLFWPALFALEGGDGPEAAEFAQLKGQYEALRTVSVEKKCDIEFAKDLNTAIKK
jgi:hypothetical protein